MLTGVKVIRDDDSMPALSYDGGAHDRVREEPTGARFRGDTVRCARRPWPDVEITAWPTAAPPRPTAALDLRTHRVRTGRVLHTAAGAFAVGRGAGVERSAGTGLAAWRQPPTTTEGRT
ncbi:DUF2264 C-terminal domain-containing protein [Streptomyces acidicola]|uniref:DUF2264 domain-containing protein n=1 Tax=Streptomyces acidicola TaxID=2596892 RepID=A0A5N8WN80_9ACTN|nr:hypothetical protein [Streptomyces acidicola]MPY47994.1 hypothetical protein [Streptomyces acidicola]